MAPRRGRSPTRRGAVALLLAVAAAMGTVVALAVLLVPPGEPIPPLPDRVTATCEDPMRDRAPVPATTAVLFTCPAEFDGRVVEIRGEAVGDVLDGPGDRSWVQVNDDAYADAGPLQAHGLTLGTNSGVAVLLPRDHRPEALGGPAVWGDRLRVVGEYQVASAADQGGPAVIADTVELLQGGRPVPGMPAVALRRAALVAIVITAGVGVAVQRHRSHAG